MVKRIMLDSRDWITIARIAIGKEKDPVLKTVYRKIKKLSETNKAIFPISMYHLEDMIKNSNKKQREYLVDIIIDISKGWTMKPFSLFRGKEVENALLRRLGLKPIHDIKSQIIGKGIAYTAGVEYYLSSKNPSVQKLIDEKESEWRNRIDSPESMAKIMKSEDFSSYLRQEHKMYLNGARTMEKNRKHTKDWTKTQRYNNEITSYFSSFIVPHLIKIVQDYNIQKNATKFFKTKKDFELFLEYTPSSNILVRLTHARDEESRERKIQANDLIDISHLAGGIPYCDIVVMEKMFASLCRKLKLDKKYGCVVLNSLKSLNKIL